MYLLRLSLLLMGLGAPMASAFGQSFSSPESVCYDAPRHRWLVSQNGANRIDAYRPGAGGLTTFTSAGITSGPHGLEIVGDTLYACDGGVVRGFLLTTGAPVRTINLNASFLNGLTSDGVRYLFATDFSTRRIFRIDTRSGGFNQLAPLTRTPNGILFDSANHRLVLVTWGANAAVQALSLADSTVSTLATTSLGSFDGLARDRAGRWYVSAWSTNALHRFDADFSNPPTQVLGGLSNPADIAFNAAGDSLAIPNSGGANNVRFYLPPPPTGLAGAVADPPLRCWPVPAVREVEVELSEAEAFGAGATLTLLDAMGCPVRSPQRLIAPRTRVVRGELAAGTYFILLTDKRRRAARQVLFVD